MKSKKEKHPASSYKPASKKQKHLNRKEEGSASLQDHSSSRYNELPKDIDAERHPEEQVIRD